MESFLNENNVLNISVRYSPESSQQRGGKKAREKRREKRELARTGGQSVSQVGSQRTSLENGEIQEEGNKSGRDENCFIIQDNQCDLLYKDQCDYIDIHRQINKACLKLIPERDQLDAGPVRSLQKPVTSRHRDQDRLVKVKLDRENYGHLFNLLKMDQEQMKKDQEQMKKDQEQMKKNQEQMSRSNQNERIKTDKQTKVFKRTWCFYCQKYCEQLHYCTRLQKFRQEDSFMCMLLEGDNEEDLEIVGRYSNKFNMREGNILVADKWFKKKHDEELFLAEEKQHMLLKTKPKPLDVVYFITEEPKGELVLKWKLSPELGPHLQNKYLVEYAKHNGETWNNLAVTEKEPLDKIKLTTFPWDPDVEYKFRVSVINRHGMSPASKCTMTTDMSEENRARWKKIKQSPENMERRIQQREHEQRIQSNILRHKL